jgi:hypothetical protein
MGSAILMITVNLLLGVGLYQNANCAEMKLFLIVAETLCCASWQISTAFEALHSQICMAKK